MLEFLKKDKFDQSNFKNGGKINDWRSRDCLKYKNSKKIIKPQYALQRLDALTKNTLLFSQQRLVNIKCGLLSF